MSKVIVHIGCSFDKDTIKIFVKDDNVPFKYGINLKPQPTDTFNEKLKWLRNSQNNIVRYVDSKYSSSVEIIALSDTQLNEIVREFEKKLIGCGV